MPKIIVLGIIITFIIGIGVGTITTLQQKENDIFIAGGNKEDSTSTKNSDGINCNCDISKKDLMTEKEILEIMVKNKNLLLLEKTEEKIPNHQWFNTSLRFQKSNGEWGDYVNLKGEQGVAGLKGEKGEKGDKGNKGDIPAHQWSGSSLSFQNPDGSWGRFVNLKGEKGDKGEYGDMIEMPAGGVWRKYCISGGRLIQYWNSKEYCEEEDKDKVYLWGHD